MASAAGVAPTTFNKPANAGDTQQVSGGASGGGGGAVTSTYTVVVATGAGKESFLPVKLVAADGSAFYNAGGGGVQTISVAVDSFTASNAGFTRGTHTVVGVGGTPIVVNGTITVVGIAGAGIYTLSTNTVVSGSSVTVFSDHRSSINVIGSTMSLNGISLLSTEATLSALNAKVTAVNTGAVTVTVLPPSGSTTTVVGVSGAGVLAYGTMTVVGVGGTNINVTAQASTLTVVGVGGQSIVTNGTHTVVGIGGSGVLVYGTMTIVGIGGNNIIQVGVTTGSYSNPIYSISTNTMAGPLSILTRSSQTLTSALGSVTVFPAEATRRSFEIWVGTANTDAILCDWTAGAVSTSPIVLSPGANFTPTQGCPTGALNCTVNGGTQILRGFSYGP